MILSTTAVNDILDNGMKALFNSGTLEFRTGAAPANADTVASGTLLGTATFGSPAFGVAASKIITANAITQDSSTDAAGDVGYVRAYESDASVIGDLSVGLTGSGAEVEMASITIAALGTLSVTSMTITQ